MITMHKLERYEDYKARNGIKGTVEIANAFYVGYSEGYERACEEYSQDCTALRERVKALKKHVEALENSEEVRALLRMISDKSCREARLERELLSTYEALMGQYHDTPGDVQALMPIARELAGRKEKE